jgi:pimeloyl-ACP methyl ester carboxylesterase
MVTTIDGIRLAYDDAGHGEPLVLLHGFPLDRTIWDAQAAALSARYRVIRIDLRGSGESAVGDGPALMETLAGDVCGLLDALDLDCVAIAGHSMGGYVALAFFRMYAERVAGLGLVASTVAADTPARRAERERLIDIIAAGGMAAVAASLTARDPAVTERIRAIARRHDPAGAAAQLIGMKERLDCADLLADIQVPALIIAGADDPLIPAATLEATARSIADVEFCRLPDCAHLPMLEAPAATTAALERLVARCALSRAAGPGSVRATRA